MGRFSARNHAKDCVKFKVTAYYPEIYHPRLCVTHEGIDTGRDATPGRNNAVVLASIEIPDATRVGKHKPGKREADSVFFLFRLALAEFHSNSVP
jgi:hypothetical protein